MRRDPKAFDGINQLPGSYWAGRGKFQSLCNELHKRIPRFGGVVSPKLEKFRKASNCYYDLYNNGLGNRAAEFRKVFGFAGTKATAEAVERKMDSITLAAADEQGIKEQS